MKPLLIWVLPALFLLVGCSGQETCNCTLNDEMDVYNDSLLTNQNWDNGLFGEVGLKDLRSNQTNAIRMLVVSDWPDSVVHVYSLTQSNRGAQLVLSEYLKYDDYRIPDISAFTHDTIAVSTENWNALNKELNERCFWSMLVEEPMVLDGTIHSIEVYRVESNPCTRNKYHSVKISSRYGKDDFYSISNGIAQLANSNKNMLQQPLK
ncbi:MAG: hypothetical protein K9J17_17600 [Flavobacteriales bacterium]|nr:hypothetical protein [Flavobacteriales bacterium]